MNRATRSASSRSSTRRRRIADGLLIVAAIIAMIVIVTRYGMPFRMDDVLYMQWANNHSFWDAFRPGSGEIFLSFRPVMAMSFWLMTHLYGADHYWLWHLKLVGSFFIAIGFAGLCARYLSQRWVALQITAIVYWLAFLPILNILFWFSDMTYAFEMMFVCGAWYFGLRAFDEFKTSFWVTANILGVLAVMTKEPALLLVHGMFLSMVILRRRRIQRGLKPLDRNGRIIWASMYLFFCVVSLLMLVSSNATSTRFFHIGSVGAEAMRYFVNDRLRYYSDLLTNPILVAFMISGIIGLVFADHSRTVRKSAILALLLVIVAAVLLLVCKPLFVLLALVAPLMLALQGGNRASLRVMVAPLAVMALINAGFLLVTIMLVKTQIAELSFLMTAIASVGTVSLFSFINEHFLTTPTKRNAAIAIAIIAVVGTGFILMPKLEQKETLLRNVRASRMHANEAIRSMAATLPTNATVVVTSPALIGLSSEDELTSKDDTYKVYAQHTFLQGFVRAYFEALYRPDLQIAYLADSTMLPRILDSCRSVGDHYLFLETAMDVDIAHGKRNGQTWMRPSDSLVASFTDGGFPSEVWKLSLRATQ